jgi:ubiquitin carboxyl-terminal hydrolase L3
MVEQPVKAIILLFPVSDVLEVKRKEEDLRLKTQAQPLLKSVFWIKQTVCLCSRLFC